MLINDAPKCHFKIIIIIITIIVIIIIITIIIISSSIMLLLLFLFTHYQVDNHSNIWGYNWYIERFMDINTRGCIPPNNIP